MKNYTKTKNLLKRYKRFNIGKTSPIRYINPFKYKNLNLEYLYNTIYIFNKMFWTNFKPIPYSEKLSKIEKQTNKGIVESILYEIRLLFWSYLLLICSYFWYLYMHEEWHMNFWHITIFSGILLIGILIIIVLFKLLKRPKNQKLPSEKIFTDQFCETPCPIIQEDEKHKCKKN